MRATERLNNLDRIIETLRGKKLTRAKRIWKWKEIKRKEGGGFLTHDAFVGCGFGARFGLCNVMLT